MARLSFTLRPNLFANTLMRPSRVPSIRKNTIVRLEIEMSLQRFSLSICAFAMLSRVVHAHAGHGDPSDSTGIVHYLTSPMHALPLLVAAVVATAIAFVVMRNRRLSAVKMNR